VIKQIREQKLPVWQRVVLDTATKLVAARIPGIAGRIAITPDGKRVYVAENTNHPDSDLKVTVIDAATNKVSTTVELGKGLALATAITPDGKYVYVAASASGSILVLDTATNIWLLRYRCEMASAPVRLPLRQMGNLPT
jgi:YVTN family beta-propeller protein